MIKDRLSADQNSSLGILEQATHGSGSVKAPYFNVVKCSRCLYELWCGGWKRGLVTWSRAATRRPSARARAREVFTPPDC